MLYASVCSKVILSSTKWLWLDGFKEHCNGCYSLWNIDNIDWIEGFEAISYLRAKLKLKIALKPVYIYIIKPVLLVCVYGLYMQLCTA